jgi:integrase
MELFRLDPSRPVKKWIPHGTLPKLRFHDLRHTIITGLAEAGVPDHVMESISGHLSRRMLEHYSHVRLQAKREALDALDARREARFEEIASKSGTQ